MITVSKLHSEHFSAFQECKGKKKAAAVIEAEMDLPLATVLFSVPTRTYQKKGSRSLINDL